MYNGQGVTLGWGQFPHVYVPPLAPSCQNMKPERLGGHVANQPENIPLS